MIILSLLRKCTLYTHAFPIRIVNVYSSFYYRIRGLYKDNIIIIIQYNIIHFERCVYETMRNEEACADASVERRADG